MNYTKEQIERYKNRLQEDMKDYNFMQLYHRNFELGIAKYTVKEAQEILENVYENYCIDNKIYPREILCSVEFFDSLKRKVSDISMRFCHLPIKVVYNQKEDICFN